MAQHQSYPSKVTWQVYMKFSSAGATVDLKPFVLPAHTGRNAAVSVVLLYGSMTPDRGVTSKILVPEELICWFLTLAACHQRTALRTEK